MNINLEFLYFKHKSISRVQKLVVVDSTYISFKDCLKYKNMAYSYMNIIRKGCSISSTVLLQNKENTDRYFEG